MECDETPAMVRAAALAEDSLRAFRQVMEDLQMRVSADPDGELEFTARVLLAKRGCRR